MPTDGTWGAGADDVMSGGVHASVSPRLITEYRNSIVPFRYHQLVPSARIIRPAALQTA